MRGIAAWVYGQIDRNRGESVIDRQIWHIVLRDCRLERYRSAICDVPGANAPAGGASGARIDMQAFTRIFWDVLRLVWCRQYEGKSSRGQYGDCRKKAKGCVSAQSRLESMMARIECLVRQADFTPATVAWT